MHKYMIKAEYARHRGVARQTVQTWERRGNIKMFHGTVDVAASDKMLNARMPVYRGGKKSANR
jgi:predicted site-specific integrase-resolvase